MFILVCILIKTSYNKFSLLCIEDMQHDWRYILAGGNSVEAPRSIEVAVHPAEPSQQCEKIVSFLTEKLDTWRVLEDMC